MKAGESGHRPGLESLEANRAEPPAEPVVLPSERGFLLQLTSASRPPAGEFAGRLEHLSSGRRVRFSTWAEFEMAVAELLGRAD